MSDSKAASRTNDAITAREAVLWVLALGLPVLFGIGLWVWQDEATHIYHVQRARLLHDPESLRVALGSEPRDEDLPALLPAIVNSRYYRWSVPSGIASPLSAPRFLANETLSGLVRLGPAALPALLDALSQLPWNPGLRIFQALDILDPTCAALFDRIESQPLTALSLTPTHRQHLLQMLFSADPERALRLVRQTLASTKEAADPQAEFNRCALASATAELLELTDLQEKTGPALIRALSTRLESPKAIATLQALTWIGPRMESSGGLPADERLLLLQRDLGSPEVRLIDPQGNLLLQWNVDTLPLWIPVRNLAAGTRVQFGGIDQDGQYAIVAEGAVDDVPASGRHRIALTIVP